MQGKVREWVCLLVSGSGAVLSLTFCFFSGVVDNVLTITVRLLLIE